MKLSLLFFVIIASICYIGISPTTFDVFGEPVLYDDNLILEVYSQEFFGWGYTTMTFVDDDILLLDKNGYVNLIQNGIKQEKPVLE
ncbi:MAG: hypothetical protein ACRBB2_08630, partial [Nitrosopumilus sp.]